MSRGWELRADSRFRLAEAGVGGFCQRGGKLRAGERRSQTASRLCSLVRAAGAPTARRAGTMFSRLPAPKAAGRDDEFSRIPEPGNPPSGGDVFAPAALLQSAGRGLFSRISEPRQSAEPRYVFAPSGAPANHGAGMVFCRSGGSRERAVQQSPRVSARLLPRPKGHPPSACTTLGHPQQTTTTRCSHEPHRKRPPPAGQADRDPPRHPRPPRARLRGAPHRRAGRAPP